MRSLSFAVLALACGCHDPGLETLATAKNDYAALITAGTPARSVEFDRLVERLASIPKGSKAHAEARRLVQAIASARAGAVDRPLAVPPGASLDPATAQPDATLRSLREQCERLATELAAVGGEARAQQLQRLERCRTQADARAAVLFHGEAGDAGVHAAEAVR